MNLEQIQVSGPVIRPYVHVATTNHTTASDIYESKSHRICIPVIRFAFALTPSSCLCQKTPAGPYLQKYKNDVDFNFLSFLFFYTPKLQLGHVARRKKG